jgi:hypothetical protein
MAGSARHKNESKRLQRAEGLDVAGIVNVKPERRRRLVESG